MSTSNGQWRLRYRRIKARHNVADRARLLAGAIVPGDGRRWTVEEVQNRLLECARDMERVTSAPGPSQKMTFWVDWQLFRGVSDFERNAMAEGIRERKRAPARGRFVLDARAHSRISEALDWPMRYLASHDDERIVLQVWAWCKATRQPFSRFYHIACDHRSTAYIRRDRAFEIIMDGLIMDGVQP